MSEAVRNTDSSRTVIVRLSPETHRALRIRVAEEDTSIQKWLEALLERELGLAAARRRGQRPADSSPSQGEVGRG